MKKIILLTLTAIQCICQDLPKKGYWMPQSFIKSLELNKTYKKESIIESILFKEDKILVQTTCGELSEVMVLRNDKKCKLNNVMINLQCLKNNAEDEFYIYQKQNFLIVEIHHKGEKQDFIFTNKINDIDIINPRIVEIQSKLPNKYNVFSKNKCIEKNLIIDKTLKTKSNIFKNISIENYGYVTKTQKREYYKFKIDTSLYMGFIDADGVHFFEYKTIRGREVELKKEKYIFKAVEK